MEELTLSAALANADADIVRINSTGTPGAMFDDPDDDEEDDDEPVEAEKGDQD